jgi:hypothetical protein
LSLAQVDSGPPESSPQTGLTLVVEFLWSSAAVRPLKTARWIGAAKKVAQSKPEHLQAALPSGDLA